MGDNALLYDFVVSTGIGLNGVSKRANLSGELERRALFCRREIVAIATVLWSFISQFCICRLSGEACHDPSINHCMCCCIVFG